MQGPCALAFCLDAFSAREAGVHFARKRYSAALTDPL